MIGIKKHPLLENALGIFIPERNTGHECGFLAEEFLTFKNTYALSIDGKEFGAWTAKGDKIKYLYAARNHMIMDSLVYAEHLVCMNPFLNARDRLDITLKKFHDQMKSYQFVGTEEKNAHQMVKYTASGKTDKNVIFSL